MPSKEESMRTVGKTVAGKTVRVTAPKAAAEKADG